MQTEDSGTAEYLASGISGEFVVERVMQRLQAP